MADEVMISKVGLTGNFEVVITLPGERVIRALLPPLLSAAMDVARNHWSEVLDLHYERQGRAAHAVCPECTNDVYPLDRQVRAESGDLYHYECWTRG